MPYPATARGLLALRPLPRAFAPSFVIHRGQSAALLSACTTPSTRRWNSSSSSGSSTSSSPSTSPSAAPSAAAAAGPKNDYANSICLPQTSMEMRANASTREPLIQRLWDGLYDWQAARESALPPFILHDGPPFANGKPHMGHFLNKTLKDITCRYRIMQGQRISHIPGWDCHGLPIEQKALESLKVKEHRSISPIDIRKKCKEFAEATIAQQAVAFRRWGVLADWERPYITMRPEYEAEQLAVFYRMYAQGQVHRGYKPVYWSPSSQTALAEAELEYHDHTSKSVYIRFPLTPSPALLKHIAPHAPAHGDTADTLSALVWTTTPWTIPANQALAVNPKLAYVLVKHAGTGEQLVVAQELLPSVAGKLKADLQVLATFSGTDLLDSTYRHPFVNRQGRILSSSHVTSDSGSGIVHMAPAHGVEDFGVCKPFISAGNANDPLGLGKVLSLVGERGEYLPEAGADLAGLNVLGAGNDKVIEMLQAHGRLALVENFAHRYPYDWRTHKPVILRATQQWFADLSDIKTRAQSALEHVKMIPETGKARLSSMLEHRNEWCISRQRCWGVPIPVFYDDVTGDALLTDASFNHVLSLVRTHGTDCWWTLPVEELLAPEYRNNGRRYVKGRDTMDVWFDSGSSWRAVVQARHGAGTVADLYLEGSDQHRGWFQSSLLTSVAVSREPEARAPYKAILTHGFVVDEDGKKMSKSLGNGIDPNDVITGASSGKNKPKMPPYGADVLRLWVASSDFTGDVSIGPTSLNLASEQHRKIRNTGRFMVGVLSDFDAEKDSVAYNDMDELDRYMLHIVSDFARSVTESYDNYAYLRVNQAISSLITLDLSSFYFEITKDRLYVDERNGRSRRAAQTVMHHIWDAFTRGVAPIACHVGEELYNYRFGRDPAKDAGCVSVAKSGWIKTDAQWNNPDLARKWEGIRQVRKAVFKAVQEAREAKVVGGSADSVVTIHASPELLEVLRPLNATTSASGSLLNAVFLTSEVELVDAGSESGKEKSGFFEVTSTPSGKEANGWVEVRKTTQCKCPRCWTFTSTKEDELCKRCNDVVN